MLSDAQILERIEAGDILISSFDRKNLGPNSYDVHLSPHVAMYKDPIIDAKKDNPLRRFIIPEEGMILYPDQFYLMSTIEWTSSINCVPIIDGKSSTGRLGISIHETAGSGDNGFSGHWTLEVSTKIPVRVYAGMPIGQIKWFGTGICLKPYNKKGTSKYNDQPELPQGSKMFRNFI